MLTRILTCSLACALALLFTVAPGQAADDQTTTGAAASAPTGPVVTIKGNVYCQRAMVPPLGTCERNSTYIPILVAMDGTAEIKAQVAAILKEYWPANNTLDLDQARKLNDAWCEKLTYCFTPFDIQDKQLPNRDKLHHEIEFGSHYMAVTGVLSEKDGKKWITPTKLEGIRWYEKDTFVPAQMLLPDKPLVQAGDKKITLQVTDKLSFNCILLPAGKFWMGSPFYQIRYQDEFPHEVVLTKSYYMAEIPVTQEMFEAVISKNPSTNIGPQFPVENVPMADIQEFCRILSEKNHRKVRLPTDAEFEYAAQVGTSSPCFHEKYVDQFSYVAVKKAEGIPSNPIKTKQPNAWGLYDMVSCGWHTTGDYKMCNFRGKEVDPTGPARPVQQYADKDGSHGPLYKSRGGWYYGKVRPNQHGANKDNGGYYEGIAIFRVVVEAESPAASAPGLTVEDIKK
jgi:formylglycine-generating enzyme required for sulfatase activity